MNSSNFSDSQFMALTGAYIELVRELVECGVLKPDAIPNRLEKLAPVLAKAAEDEMAAKLVNLLRKGVTKE